MFIIYNLHGSNSKYSRNIFIWVQWPLSLCKVMIMKEFTVEHVTQRCYICFQKYLILTTIPAFFVSVQIALISFLCYYILIIIMSLSHLASYNLFFLSIFSIYELHNVTPKPKPNLNSNAP